MSAAKAGDLSAIGKHLRTQAHHADDEDLVSLANRFTFSDINEPGQFQVAASVSGIRVSVAVEAGLDLGKVFESLEEESGWEMKAGVELGQSVDHHSVLGLYTLPSAIRSTRDEDKFSWRTRDPLCLMLLRGRSALTTIDASVSVATPIPVGLSDDGSFEKLGASVAGHLERAWTYQLVDTDTHYFPRQDREKLKSHVDALLNAQLKKLVVHWLLLNGRVPEGQSNVAGAGFTKALRFYRWATAGKSRGGPFDPSKYEALIDLRYSTDGLTKDLDRQATELTLKLSEQPLTVDPATLERRRAPVRKRLAEVEFLRSALRQHKDAKDAPTSSSTGGDVVVPVPKQNVCFVRIRSYGASAEAGTSISGSSVGLEVKVTRSRLQALSPPSGARQRRLFATHDTEIEHFLRTGESKDLGEAQGYGSTAYRSVVGVWTRPETASSNRLIRVLAGYSGLARGISASEGRLHTCVDDPTSVVVKQLAAKLGVTSSQLENFFGWIHTSFGRRYVKNLVNQIHDGGPDMALLLEAHSAFVSDQLIRPKHDSDKVDIEPIDLLDALTDSTTWRPKSAGREADGKVELQSIRLRVKLSTGEDSSIGVSFPLGPIEAVKIGIHKTSSVGCVQMFDPAILRFPVAKNPDDIPPDAPTMAPIPFLVA